MDNADPMNEVLRTFIRALDKRHPFAPDAWCSVAAITDHVLYWVHKLLREQGPITPADNSKIRFHRTKFIPEKPAAGSQEHKPCDPEYTLRSEVLRESTGVLHVDNQRLSEQHATVMAAAVAVLELHGIIPIGSEEPFAVVETDQRRGYGIMSNRDACDMMLWGLLSKRRQQVNKRDRGGGRVTNGILCHEACDQLTGGIPRLMEVHFFQCYKFWKFLYLTSGKLPALVFRCAETSPMWHARSTFRAAAAKCVSTDDDDLSTTNQPRDIFVFGSGGEAVHLETAALTQKQATHTAAIQADGDGAETAARGEWAQRIAAAHQGWECVAAVSSGECWRYACGHMYCVSFVNDRTVRVCPDCQAKTSAQPQ